MATTAQERERELAEHYEQTRDVSDFDESAAYPVKVRRDVTISVRFSADEIEKLRAAAEKADMPVTTYIRQLATLSTTFTWGDAIELAQTLRVQLASAVEEIDVVLARK
jgi:predicted DNA binding CopG/RHH family protein